MNLIQSLPDTDRGCHEDDDYSFHSDPSPIQGTAISLSEQINPLRDVMPILGNISTSAAHCYGSLSSISDHLSSMFISKIGDMSFDERVDNTIKPYKSINPSTTGMCQQIAYDILIEIVDRFRSYGKLNPSIPTISSFVPYMILPKHMIPLFTNITVDIGKHDNTGIQKYGIHPVADGTMNVYVDYSGELDNIFIGSYTMSDKLVVSAGTFELLYRGNGDINSEYGTSITEDSYIISHHIDLPSVIFNLDYLLSTFLNCEVDDAFVPAEMTSDSEPITNDPTRDLSGWNKRVDEIMGVGDTKPPKKLIPIQRSETTSAGTKNWVEFVDSLDDIQDWEDTKFIMALATTMMNRLNECDSAEEMEKVATQLDSNINKATSAVFDMVG